MGSAIFKHQQMSGRQFIDAGKHGFRRRYKFKTEIIIQGLIIDRPFHLWNLENGFNFRGKNQTTIGKGIIKRFYTDTITDKQQFFLRPIIEGKGKHAAQPVYAFLPIFFVGVKDDLGIGLTLKTMSFLQEFRPQFLKIIYFPVKDQVNGIIFIGHGLGTIFAQINDGQTTKGKRHFVTAEDTLLIRPPMGDLGGHFPSQRLVIPVKSTNSTHGQPSACPLIHKKADQKRSAYTKLSRKKNLLKYLTFTIQASLEMRKSYFHPALTNHLLISGRKPLP